MIADQPFVSYKRKKKKEATKKQMDDFADAWLARKEKEKKEKEGKGINDPLDAFRNSKKTTMSDFFKQNKKE